MTAFFVWLEYGLNPIDHQIAKSMLDSIDGYGGDAKDLQLSSELAIGVQSRWLTQEDVGECQPLYDASQNHCLVFDGRIDNREHLLVELAMPVITAKSPISDAQLLHLFLQRFGEARMPEVIGPFAFVWIDLIKREITAMRDTMGGRYLCYCHNDRRLIIASTELAFLAHPDVGHTLRVSKVKNWLFGKTEAQHQACLNTVSVVNPGQRLRWQRARPQQIDNQPFYRPDPTRRIRLQSDHAYALEFRRLLDQAVKRRLRRRTHKNVGVMLSGGMDSVPIAIAAASQIDDKAQLSAYSWVFDEEPSMDERHYSTPLCRQLGIKQHLQVCDELWPVFDETTHNNPLFPVALPYSEFQQETFRHAQRQDVTVLLTGLQGDLLYETSNREVLEKCATFQFRDAWNTFHFQKKAAKLSLWQALKRFVIAPHRWVAPWLDYRRQRRSPAAPESVDETDSKTSGKHWLTKESRQAARPSQYQIVFDGFAGEDAMLGRPLENKYAIERRYPFRDRELCEFLIAIPTDQLQRLNTTRPIVKRAYKAELTPELLLRNDKTDFSKSLINGIKRDEKWRSLLAEKPQYWRKFVKNGDISNVLSPNSTELVMLWRCAYYNFWYRLWYDSNANDDCENDR